MEYGENGKYEVFLTSYRTLQCTSLHCIVNVA